MISSLYLTPVLLLVVAFVYFKPQFRELLLTALNRGVCHCPYIPIIEKYFKQLFKIETGKILLQTFSRHLSLQILITK